MRDEWVGTSETDPIQVDFLPDDEVVTPPGRLGMTFAPGMWAAAVPHPLRESHVASSRDERPLYRIKPTKSPEPDWVQKTASPRSAKESPVLGL